MRILHTSDWHLGQHFMGMTRQAEHAAFCQWLIEQVKTHQVDAVIIAGDIFDTGAPPSYAREQYNRFIVALKHTGATLLVLGGNHDSVATLGESQALLSYLGTHVVPCVTGDDQVLVLNRKDGSPGAVVCAIPFVRPRDVLKSEAGQSAATKQQSLQSAIKEHYQALHEQAMRKVAELGGALPIIATGHLTTVGASASESVREIYVGSLEAFPTSAFAPADYIALGHIHRPQKVGGFEHIRYCGSPIALSFDEAKQQKEVLLVDVAQGCAKVTPLLVPCFQPMVSLKGTLSELANALQAVSAQGSVQQPVWAEVTVAGDDYLSDLHARLNALTDTLPVQILRVRRAREQGQNALLAHGTETLDELDVHQVFARRMALEEQPPELAQALLALHQEVVQEVLQPSDTALEAMR